MDDDISTEDFQTEELKPEILADGNKSKNITIKKANYTLLVVGAIVSIAASTFFGGYFLGTLENSDSYVTAEQLKSILNTAPTDVPTVFEISLDDDPIKGDPDAPLTIVEFSDFQCPFCSRFYQQTLPQIEENYINTGKVNFVYRDLPLDNIHPNAKSAHIAAECADEQGSFWEYHDVLFDKQAEWQKLDPAAVDKIFKDYASSLDLELMSFDTCTKSEEMRIEVNKDLVEGFSYGATGTPTFFIGNEKDGFVKISGAQPFSAFQNEIDSQLG